MAKLLGVDFGSKRVGLSLSDEGANLAFPHSVLENNPKLLEKIKKIISEEKVEIVVIGESTNFQGQPNEIMGEIEKFKENLAKETEAKIFLEPEFLSSVEARHIQGENEMHDASAAAIILQSFLDKTRKPL